MAEKQFKREIETKTTIRIDIEEIEAMLRGHLKQPNATFEWEASEDGEHVFGVRVVSIARSVQEPSP